MQSKHDGQVVLLVTIALSYATHTSDYSDCHVTSVVVSIVPAISGV